MVLNLVHTFSRLGRRLNANVLIVFQAYFRANRAIFCPPADLPGGPAGGLRAFINILPSIYRNVLPSGGGSEGLARLG